MLHQEQSDTPITPAAETRVSAKELADAVAALQARKEEAARRVEGTIPIGQAVQELGLDATPDEILAEVQAQRLPQRRAPWPKRHRRLTAIAGVGLALIVWAGWFGPQPRPDGSMPAVTNTTPFVASYAPPPSFVQTLAEVPDKHPVLCTSAQLHTLLHNPRPSLSRILVQDFRLSDRDANWCLIKHHGQLYLHGAMMNMTDEAMRVGGIRLHNSETDETGIGGLVYETPVSFKIGAFTCTSGPQSDTGELALQITDVHPDQYANEALKGVDRG